MDLMTLVAFFHVGIALLLIVLVLLQDPKGGGAAGVFGGGGGSQSSFFGATGAGSFLSTLTKWMAIAFAVTSIGMTYMTSHSGSSSIMDDYIPEAPAATESGMDPIPDAGADKSETPSDSGKTKDK